MIDWPELESESLAMIRAAAPELTAENLYLCDTAAMTGSAAPSRQIYAFTSDQNDLVVKPYVRWKGRGIAISYCRAALAEDAIDDRNIPQLFHPLMIHEICHALSRGILAKINEPHQPEPRLISVQREASIDLATRERNENDGYADVFLQHHNAAFIRTICHIKKRIETRCNKLFALSMIHNKNHGPHASFFLRALGDEPTVFAEWPIADVLRLPLPAEFAELWEREQQDYREMIRAKARRPMTYYFSQGDHNMSLFNKIEEMLGLKKKKRADNFQSLAVKVADGERVAPQEAADILDQTGRTTQDLQAAVDQVKRRRELRKAVDAGATIAAERASIIARATAANQILERAEQVHQETIDPLRNREFELNGIERAAAAAAEELHKGADPALHARLRELGAEHGKLNQRRFELTNLATASKTTMIEAAQHIKNLEENAHFNQDARPQIIAARAALTSREHELQVWGRELSDIDVAMAALQQQIDAASAALLQP